MWTFGAQNGESENVALFLTDVATEQIERALVEKRVDQVAVLTDRVQRWPVQSQSRAAHARHFHPMFACLRSVEEGSCERHSAVRASFADLPRTNDRTDDKTLILALRRVPSAAAFDG